MNTYNIQYTYTYNRCMRPTARQLGRNNVVHHLQNTVQKKH